MTDIPAGTADNLACGRGHSAVSTGPLGATTPADSAVAARAILAVVQVSRMLERSSPELSLAHYRVLSAVAAGDGRASRLARRLALGKPAISAAVEALCRRGLLLRGGVDGDQRAAALSLTAEGSAILDAAQAEMIAVVARLCSRTADGARVMESLAALGAAFDEVVVERMAAAKQVLQ
ncbi:MAG TPA: MarR family winged helix-turn-helix transcriptional regulator [Jatrophihabitantaceae bacterium]|nr:MarR family winged helix-turn-helix transcriptional regulator [Jatrophihabitantaceae bacterium]